MSEKTLGQVAYEAAWPGSLWDLIPGRYKRLYEEMGRSVKAVVEAPLLARIAELEKEREQIAECLENDDCDHLPLVERVAGCVNSLQILIGSWMDGKTALETAAARIAELEAHEKARC